MNVMFQLSRFIYFVIVCIILSTLLLSCKSSFPHSKEPVECNGQLLKPVLNPTKRADFPGGKQAMYEFLKKEINFPQEAIKSKIRVAFIVTKEGKICDVRITSKSKEYLDSEIMRVIEKMPKWIPGINEGEIVDCYYLLDIRF